jgi:hypothetical protein
MMVTPRPLANTEGGSHSVRGRPRGSPQCEACAAPGDTRRTVWRNASAGLALAVMVYGCASGDTVGGGTGFADDPPATASNPGGAPGADGGSGSGGDLPDAGTSVPASSCAEIAPPDSPQMIQYVQNPWFGLGFDRGNAAADLSGSLALVVNGGHGDVVDFVSPSGKILRASSTSMDGFVLPQPPIRTAASCLQGTCRRERPSVDSRCPHI